MVLFPPGGISVRLMVERAHSEPAFPYANSLTFNYTTAKSRRAICLVCHNYSCRLYELKARSEKSKLYSIGPVVVS